MANKVDKVQQLGSFVNSLGLSSTPIRPSIVQTDNDRLAQYVSFRGKSEVSFECALLLPDSYPYLQPLIEPHVDAVAVEKRMESLWKARWSEHVVESHVKHLGSSGDTAARVSNTPLQLYLLYNRLIRARMEVDIYSDVLSR